VSRWDDPIEHPGAWLIALLLLVGFALIAIAFSVPSDGIVGG
jgi:hypothetical protein